MEDLELYRGECVVVKRIFSQSKSFFILLSLISVFFSHQLMAKNIAHEQKKIALVNKFIQYVSWPDEAVNESFLIAIYKDSELLPLFKNAFENKTIKGKTVNVIVIDNIESATYINLLYVPAIYNGDITSLVKAIRNHNILLVTENSKNKQNVMINLLFRNENAKVNFEVNKLNLSREKLKASSWLLFSGGKEISTSTSMKEAKESMDDMVQRKLMLENELISLEQKAEQTFQQLEERRQQVLENDRKLKEQSNKLNNVMQESVKVQQVIIENEKKLTTLNEEIAKVKAELTRQRKIRDDKNNVQVAALKEEYQQKFLQQMDKIDELAAALVTKEQALKEATSKLSQTQPLVEKAKNDNSSIVTIILVVVALAGIGGAAFFFIQHKKAREQFSQTQTGVDELKTQLAQAQQQLTKTQQQLIQSETVASFSYISSDVTYEVGASLENIILTNNKLAKTEVIAQQVASGNAQPAAIQAFINNIDKLTAKNSKQLQELATLVENFNQIGVDLDEDEKQTFELVSYVDKMMSLLSIEFEESGVEYDYQGAKKLTINTIPGQVAQVLLNLVTNSLKHGFDGKEGGKIAITIEKSAEGGAKITYQDDGNGMPPNVLKEIFKPFYTTKPERGYVGIGMSTTYQIITEKLSGKIAVESKVNKGVTFIIELP